MTIEREKCPTFVLENESIITFTDLEILGLYTYIKMLIDTENMTLPDIIEQVQTHFNFNDDYVLKRLKVIADLGLLFIAKEKK